jgi:hypothetical protein
MSIYKQVLICCQVAVLAAPHALDAQASALLRGTVRDSATSAGVSGAYVEVIGTRFSARTDDDGSFSIGTVPKGTYALRVVRLGFAPVTMPVQLADSSEVQVAVALVATPIPLAAVVVTPGFYGVMQPGLTSGHTLSRNQIESAPQLGEDVYRSVGRLPGVATNDMSARFNVRGGTGEEMYATLDGLELEDPFHLKDIDGALSILDVNSIAGIELATGGFSAEYGNRLTGVMTMHSVEPRTDRTRSALALSILNARYTGQGGARDGHAGWYLSARRGYLDIALKLVQSGDSIDPTYYDVFGKVFYDLPRYGRVTLHTLHAGDRLDYLDGPEDHLVSSYGTSYVWATWEGALSSRLRQTTVASLGRLWWHRGGDIHEQQGGRQTMLLDHRRDYDVLNVRQNWQVDLSSWALLKTGFETKAMRSTYAYENWVVRQSVQGGAIVERTDTTTAALSPDGRSIGGYLSQRVRIGPRVTAEVGARYDNASYLEDGDVTPRANVSWDVRSGTTVRAAWGRYTQPQPLYALQVSDGIGAFFPAERAEQRGVGVEQLLPNDVRARVELYHRGMTRVRPRFVNASNQLLVFPEIENDRLRIDPTSGRAGGMELFVQHAGEGRIEWSGSYALSRVTDRIGDRDVPRGVDQRHAFNVDWSFHPLSNRWRFSVGWVRHTGWPATPQTFTVDTIGTGSSRRFFVTEHFGAYNSDRLPMYQRFDVRYTRYWDTRRGRVALYADVFNLADRENARGFDYDIRSLNPYRVEREYETLLPRLPSIGISWEF